MGFKPHRGHMVPLNRKLDLRRWLWLSALGACLGAVLGYVSLEIAPPKPIQFASVSCRIKGNISMETGEHIYHMPGQRYYDETLINPAKGERYFCSQWDAWWAGWRKSKV
jgi:hypothetical protein